MTDPCKTTDEDLPSPLEPIHIVSPGKVTCVPCTSLGASYTSAIQRWKQRVRKLQLRREEYSREVEDPCETLYLQPSCTSLKTDLPSGLVIFKDVQKNDSDGQPYVRVTPGNSIAEVVSVMEQEWKINTPTIVLEVISGTDTFTSPPKCSANQQQWKRLQQGLIEAANKTNMWIVTDGLNIGMGKFMGEIARKEGVLRLGTTCPRHPRHSAMRLPRLTLLGIVRQSCLQKSDLLNGNAFVTEITNEGNNVAGDQYDLNPFHTHFMIVNDEQPHGFAQFVLNFANFLRSRPPELTSREACEEATTTGLPFGESALSQSKIPFIALLIAGGLSATSMVADHLRHCIPVVVIKGSGGAADILSFAYEVVMAKNRGAWDPDYVDNFVTDVVSKKIAEHFVKYRDDEAVRGRFRDEIMECIRLSHQGEKILLDVLDIHSSKCDLSLLNEYLLQSMFKAEKRDSMDSQWQYYTQKDIYLALDWNCSHICDMQMFSGDAYHCGIEPKLFERALIRQDREEFVELFLDRGFKIYPFLTRRRYCRLFEQAENPEFYRSICLESALGYSTLAHVDEVTLIRDVNWLVYQMTKVKNFVALQEYAIGGQRMVIDEHNSAQEQRSLNALVVWAVLMNRQKLVKVLWKRSDYPIHLALLISMMYDHLASYITEKHVCKELQDNSREFASLAGGVLSACFNTRNCRAQEVLSEEVPDYNYKTAVEMAALANNRSFIAQPSVQKWLTTIYYGDIRICNLKIGLVPTPEWIKIVLAAFLFFPMNIWIMFRTTRRESDVCGGRGDSCGFGALAAPRTLTDTYADSEVEGDIFSQIALDRKCTIEEYPIAPVHLNLVETMALTAEQKRLLFDEDIIETPYFPFWRKIAAMWGAPITKFWTHQIFYVLYLTLFSLAVAWPSCGNYYLDVALWVWTLLILFEIILVTIRHHRKFSSVRLGTGVIEIIIISLFLVTFMFVRILAAQQSYDMDIYLGRALMHGYGARVTMCLGLLYFFYRYIWIYLPIDPTLGRLLYRIRLMVMCDFMHFMRLALIFIVSSGIAIHSVIYPDYPMSWELWRRIFHKSWFSLFITPIEDLHGEPGCHHYRGTDSCRVGPYENDTCPVTGIWPYLITIQYLIILKLILITLLFALFSDTAKKLSGDADCIWRFQRYHLVLDFCARPRLPAPLNIFSFIIILFRALCRCSKCSSKCSCHRGFSGSFTSHTGSGFGIDFVDGYWRCLAKAYLEEEEQKRLNSMLPVKQMENITSIVNIIEMMQTTNHSFDVRLDQLQQSLDTANALLADIQPCEVAIPDEDEEVCI